MSPDEEHRSASRRSNVPKVRVRFLPLYQWSVGEAKQKLSAVGDAAKDALNSLGNKADTAQPSGVSRRV